MSRSDVTDRIMSVSAIVAALAAVLVAAYEARINREYQRISVWPRLSQFDSFVPDQPYTRSVSNVGMGPAMVRSVEIRVDGNICRTWPKIIEALLKRPIPNTVISSLHNGSVIVPNKDIQVLKIPAGADARAFWEASQERLSIRVCYSSLYGESWISDTESNEPAPVAQCVPVPEKEFQQ
jgi:hypothetical protein